VRSREIYDRVNVYVNGYEGELTNASRDWLMESVRLMEAIPHITLSPSLVEAPYMEASKVIVSG